MSKHCPGYDLNLKLSQVSRLLVANPWNQNQLVGDALNRGLSLSYSNTAREQNLTVDTSEMDVDTQGFQ